MIVEVVYHHSSTVRERRRAAHASRTYVASSSVAVREATGTEAPVALWWTPSNRTVSAGTQVAVRAMDGALWQPVTGRGGDRHWTLPDGRHVPGADSYEGGADGCLRSGDGRAAARGVMTVGDFVACLAQAPLFSGKLEGGVAVGSLESDGTVAEVVEDARGRYETYIVKAFSDLAIVDGLLHERIDVPIAKARKERHRPVETAPLDHYSFDIDKAGEFSVARFDDALAYAPLTPEERRRYEALRPEVLIPGALAFDEAANVAYGTARFVLRQLERRSETYARGRSSLSQYPDDVIRAYVDLRDGLSAESGVGAVMALAEAYADVASDHGTLRVERDAIRAASERLAFDETRAPDEAEMLWASP